MSTHQYWPVTAYRLSLGGGHGFQPFSGELSATTLPSRRGQVWFRPGAPTTVHPLHKPDLLASCSTCWEQLLQNSGGLLFLGKLNKRKIRDKNVAPSCAAGLRVTADTHHLSSLLPILDSPPPSGAPLPI